MANITNYLNKIKTAVYGKDVRGAIHDAIKQVYDDASVNHDNANMEVKMARGTHNTLNDRLDNVDEIQAQTNAQLSQKANDNEVVKKGYGTLNDFDEETRRVIQGMEQGQINAVLGRHNVTDYNLDTDSVTIDKVEFIEKGVNLFNKDDSTVVIGKYVGFNGSIVVDSAYYHSHKIECKKGDIFTIRYAESNFGGFFNRNGEFISRIGPASGGTEAPFTFTVPDNEDISYMVVNGRVTHIKSDMIVRGDSYPEVYMDYYATFKNVKIESKDVIFDSEGNFIPKNSITLTKFKTDYTNMALLKYLVMDQVIDATNTAVPKQGFYFYALDMEEIAERVFTVDGAVDHNIYHTYFFYNKEGKLLSKSPYSLEKIRTLTVPSNTKWFVVQGDKRILDYDKMRIIVGNKMPDHFVYAGLNHEWMENYVGSKIKENKESTDLEIEMVDEKVNVLQSLVNEMGNISNLNPLYGKCAVFDGDSICHGTSVGSSDPTYGYGWAGRIGIKNNMTWKNFGISGSTITAGIMNTSGEERRSVVKNIDNIYRQYPNADYIIFEGGTNDADLLGVDSDRLGEVMYNYIGPFDETTFIGAVESLFSKAINYYPNKKIGFIIAHKMGGVSSGRWETANRNAYFEQIRKLSKKWGIPILDLWNECHLCQDIPLIKEMMMPDGQHLTSAGYDFISDKIEAWMKTL